TTSSPPSSEDARERMHNHSTPAPEASKGVSGRRSSTPPSRKDQRGCALAPVPLRACVPPKVTADSSPTEGAVTEIPEHLLRRSRERREAWGLSTGDGGPGAAPPAAPPSTEVQPAAAAATPAPAPAPAAAPAVVAPPPKPPPPYVQA